MATSLRTCPKCPGSMERGYVADVAHAETLQTSWSPGEPVMRRFFGGIKWNPRDATALIAFRCAQCGFVEFYAP